MREITISEENFSTKEFLRTYLTTVLGLSERYAASLDALRSGLAEVSKPTRIVINRSWDGENNGEDWFDQACQAMVAASEDNECLEVTVVSADARSQDARLGTVSAEEAVARLKRGNAEYVLAHKTTTNVSSDLIRMLFEEGQHPFATIIACSDSRVVPEHVFVCGPGELFVIRVAGNVVGPDVLASAVYGCEHLHTHLLLVLGHTHCGAIEAATHGVPEGPMEPVASRIAAAIGDQRNHFAASVLNVRAAMDDLRANDELGRLVDTGELQIRGAIYHTHSGSVDFLDEG